MNFRIQLVLLLAAVCWLKGYSKNNGWPNASVAHPIQTIAVKGARESIKFRHITVNEGFSRNSVFDIIQDNKGLMWFGTWDGLFRYDGNELRQICRRPISHVHTNQIITEMLEDLQHRIWLASPLGLAVWDPIREEIVDLDFSTGGSKNRIDYPTNLCMDRHGNIWIGTNGRNLFMYSQQSEKMHDCTSLLPKECKAVTDIYQDMDGNLWLAALGIGMVRVEMTKKPGGLKIGDQYWRVETDHRFDFLRENYVHAFYQDSRGNYWAGTHQAVYCLENYGNEPIRQYQYYSQETNRLIDTKVNDFAERNGTVYAATEQGLFAYALYSDTATFQRANYSSFRGLNDQNLQKLYVDREKGLWVSSYYGGVNYSSPTDGNFSSHDYVNSKLGGHVISSIVEDADQNLWLSVEDGGVSFWNRKTNEILNFNQTSQSNIRPTNDNVHHIFLDGQTLYIGMFNHGMDMVDLTKRKLQNFSWNNTHPDQLNSSVYSFFKYNDTTLWVGTLQGIYQFHTLKHEFRRIPDIQGRINCFAEDGNGNIWVAALYGGLHRYQRQSGKWEHFLHDNRDTTSIVSNDITTVLPCGPSVYFGTVQDGLWCYHPDTGNFTPVADDALNNTFIFHLIKEDNVIWITTNWGLFAYNYLTQHLKHYTSRDGLRSNQFKKNSGLRLSDGSIVLGSVNGINLFKTSELKSNTEPPKAILTDFFLFNQPVDIHAGDSPLKRSITYSKELELNEKHHSLAFKFASSSYSDSRKNRYEYRLDPFDRKWQTTYGANNMAYYTNLPAGNYVFRLRTSNGEGIWSKETRLDITITPLWWWSWPMRLLYLGLILALAVGIFRHYREKKKEEMRLLRLEKDKEVYNSKMEFFTYMVHEIRTPLTLILGPLSNIMKKTGKVEDVLPDLRIIERNGKRLLSLVNQLMDFRKVEEKSYTIRLGEFNLCELTGEIVRNFQPCGNNRELHIETHLPATTCWALADREAYNKILSNLLSNAIKFTRNQVSVSLKPGADPAYWEIHVKDNGRGIPQADQASIFNTFYQVQNDLPSDNIGTGIGLSLVKHLTELMDGTIRLESTEGQGACFIVSLRKAEAPEWVASAEAEEAVPQPRAPRKEDNGQPRQRRLLIVEDHEEMRTYIASIFAGSFLTDTAANGKEALDLTARNEYDLVITDLMMPVMDGMTLCRTLRAQVSTSYVPIIILTAKDDDTSQLEGFESEADMYVTKPFSTEVLRSRVKSLINNRERLRRRFYSEPEAPAEILCNNDDDKNFLQQLDELIAQRMEDSNLSVDDLAAALLLGRSFFYQKVKAVSGLTPNEYLRTCRLKKAATLFKNGETRINEVCYRVGFSSPSYFTRRFTMQFGVSPSDFVRQLHQ